MKKIISIDKFFRDGQAKRFYNSFMPYQVMTCRVDITKLVKLKKKYKLNAMLCYCVQEAAQKIEHCHYLYHNSKQIEYYDRVYSNFVMESKCGKLVYVGIRYNDSYLAFEKEYCENSAYCYDNDTSIMYDDQILIATSAIINTEIVNYYPGHSEDFCESFLVWGKFSKDKRRYYLNISFKYHHGLLDGADAGRFFNQLQEEIDNFVAK